MLSLLVAKYTEVQQQKMQRQAEMEQRLQQEEAAARLSCQPEREHMLQAKMHATMQQQEHSENAEMRQQAEQRAEIEQRAEMAEREWQDARKVVLRCEEMQASLRTEMLWAKQEAESAQERAAHAETMFRREAVFQREQAAMEEQEEAQAATAMEQQLDAARAQHEEAAAARHNEFVEQQLDAARAQHEEAAAARHNEFVEQQLDAVRAQHEEAAVARVMLHAAREQEDQQAQQKEEKEASRASRAGENRKRETDGQAASSQAASSQEGGHGTPVCSVKLKGWLALHSLCAVHACDDNGWSALHHVAQDSKLSNVMGIFEELCNYVWSPAELDAVTGEAPLESHLPQGWTALHLLANGPGNQRAEMTVRLCTMRANPEARNHPRLSTPLHMAVGTANQAVTEALLEMSVNVNAKNKYNKTPYDAATSNREMFNMVKRAGGVPSDDWTGETGRDESNARAKGLASEARRKRAANWRNWNRK
jgi:ankyrin repeat protein